MMFECKSVPGMEVSDFRQDHIWWWIRRYFYNRTLSLSCEQHTCCSLKLSFNENAVDVDGESNIQRNVMKTSTSLQVIASQF